MKNDNIEVLDINNNMTKEPTIPELLEMERRPLEEKIISLTSQVYEKEKEIERLHILLNNQEEVFNKLISKLLIKLLKD